MSPEQDILIPRGYLALGCLADLLRFLDTFLSIKPRRFKILPTVLTEIFMPSGNNEWSLYLDQAGYFFLRFTTAIIAAGDVSGLLTWCGR